jgi:hypothetical protein
MVFVIALSTPASAQLLGDANCNGWAWEIADLVIVARFLVETCNMHLPPCLENSDLDGDERGLTVGDIIYYTYANNPPDYPRHPQTDTFIVESVITNPGETITLPVWISTVDTIMGFQFLLEVDTDYIEFDTLTASNDFQLIHSDCDGDVYCVTGPLYNHPVICEAGTYHICDLILTINPDINQPATTSLLFSSIPHRALYSGLANSDFFLPVFIDAQIEIVPLTDIESAEEIMPGDFEISAYPNPFNDALNISVFSYNPTEISVYDIMGRPVRTLAVAAGNNLIKWNATDESGRSLSAGIYFIVESETRSFRKVLYLK